MDFEWFTKRTLGAADLKRAARGHRRPPKSPCVSRSPRKKLEILPNGLHNSQLLPFEDVIAIPLRGDTASHPPLRLTALVVWRFVFQRVLAVLGSSWRFLAFSALRSFVASWLVFGSSCALWGGPWDFFGGPGWTSVDSLGALGCAWGALGDSLGLFGGSLGTPWKILTAPWGLLGAPWGSLGAPWGCLGGSWGLLGRSWGALVAPWRLLGDPWGLLGAPWALLWGPWEHLGCPGGGREKDEVIENIQKKGQKKEMCVYFCRMNVKLILCCRKQQTALQSGGPWPQGCRARGPAGVPGSP